MSETPTTYQHLEHRRGSNYRQLSIKGRRIRAFVVWNYVHGPDHYTPEEFAEDFDVPIEAVREALDYVEKNMDLIREEATGNEDDSWDGLWSSAGRITADGYDVEIRIPFSTLRFRDTDAARRWGVIAFRNYPRNVRHQIANVVVPRSGVPGSVMVTAGATLSITTSLTTAE